MKRRNDTLGYTLILITGTLWGMTGIFTHAIAAMGGSSLTSSFLKTAGAAIVMTLMFPLLSKSHREHLLISRRALGRSLLQGVFTQCLFVIGYLTAIDLLGMAVAAVLLYTSPFYVTILSKILFDEKITGTKLAAIALNLLGCFLTVSGGDLSLTGVSFKGVAAGLFAGLCYSTLPIFSRYSTETDDPKAVTYYATLGGLISITLLTRSWTHTGMQWDLHAFLLTLVFGLVGTAIPYLLYVKGMQLITEVSKAPVFASVENISAAILGVLLFHESMNLWKALGILLVFASVVLVNRKTSD